MTTLTYQERLKNTKKLLLACSQCDVETVKQLLPLSCSTQNYDWSICEAIKNHHTDIIEHMLPHIDYNTVFSSLLNKGFDATALQQCIEKYEALQQKEQLTQSLQTTVHSLPSHKRKL